MFSAHILRAPGFWRQAVKRMSQVAVLVLIAAMAMPARAGDERAVKARVSPVYPELAKRMGIAGEVKVQAVVDAQGKVKEAKALTGNHLLGLAAEAAVRQWSFEPGDGNSTVNVSVNFALGR